MVSKWLIKDKIKRGLISFDVGDEVVCFNRKGNGYPRLISDGDVYTIKSIENEHLYIRKHSSDGIGWLQPIRIHKTYMIPIQVLRDIKLNSLFDETKPL